MRVFRFRSKEEVGVDIVDMVVVVDVVVVLLLVVVDDHGVTTGTLDGIC